MGGPLAGAWKSKKTFSYFEVLYTFTSSKVEGIWEHFWMILVRFWLFWVLWLLPSEGPGKTDLIDLFKNQKIMESCRDMAISDFEFRGTFKDIRVNR